MTTELKHGRIPVYRHADNCDHPEPPEPEDDNADWTARDDWENDHPSCRGEDGGEPVCLSSQIGWFCPACTEAARADRDLPMGEHVECALAVPAEAETAVRAQMEER